MIIKWKKFVARWSMALVVCLGLGLIRHFVVKENTTDGIESVVVLNPFFDGFFIGVSILISILYISFVIKNWDD